jgi:hypothetical protein
MRSSPSKDGENGSGRFGWSKGAEVLKGECHEHDGCR